MSPKKISLVTAMRELLGYLPSRRRRQFIPVLALMLLGAIAELVTIGAILPFLAVISDPSRALSLAPFRSTLEWLGLNEPHELVIVMAVIFAGSALVAAGIRLLLLATSQRFVGAIAYELSVALYRRTLYQPYAYHIARNSSETLGAINKAQLITAQLLNPLMQCCSASVIALFIVAGLVAIDPVVAIGSALAFASIYFAAAIASRNILRRQGNTIAKAQSERLQAVSEGLGGVRDVLLDRSQSVFIDRYARVEQRMRRAMATSAFVGNAPRIVVEALGIMFIAGLALALSLRSGGLLAALPLLGALALGAQRLLPLMQQMHSGWTAFVGSGKMLGDILDILRLPDAPQFLNPISIDRIPFRRELMLDRVSFSYPGTRRPALDNVSLVIDKGSRIGIAGKTGSGKSTLMDIVLGLLSPASGRILVDGIELNDGNRSAWQAQIAHVPQFIYLADATIAENIAFGVLPAQIDHARVVAAAKRAELEDVIAALPNGYDTPVGERGVRLSGGQRQRVGIARALYKQASILVFDEATSALDTETETAVMEAIGRLDRDLTILLIAHRLSTLEQCDVIVRLEDGRVRSVGGEAKLVKSAIGHD